MKYFVCINSNKKFEIVKAYDNLNDAFGGIVNCLKKKNADVKIIPYPEVEPGCTIYKMDGSYYGTVAAVTQSIISIIKDDEHSSIPDPFIKDAFEILVLNGTFTVVNGIEISSVKELDELKNNIESDISKIRNRMDYVWAQQISFLGN